MFYGGKKTKPAYVRDIAARRTESVGGISMKQTVFPGTPRPIYNTY